MRNGVAKLKVSIVMCTSFSPPPPTLPVQWMWTEHGTFTRYASTKTTTTTTTTFNGHWNQTSNGSEHLHCCLAHTLFPFPFLSSFSAFFFHILLVCSCALPYLFVALTKSVNFATEKNKNMQKFLLLRSFSSVRSSVARVLAFVWIMCLGTMCVPAFSSPNGVFDDNDDDDNGNGNSTIPIEIFIFKLNQLDSVVGGRWMVNAKWYLSTNKS